MAGDDTPIINLCYFKCIYMRFCALFLFQLGTNVIKYFSGFMIF